MQKSKKIVVLGHFGVGKTSLIRRFVSNLFSEKYKVTIGVHITKKVVQISNEEQLTMILWDLEGTEDLKLLRDSYLLGAHGKIYVFDVTRPSTFQNLQEDLHYLENRMPNIPQVVIGNKSDLVDSDELNMLFKEKEVPFDYLTSAKTGDSVEQAFQEMAKILLGNHE